jgi:hypothetical protein
MQKPKHAYNVKINAPFVHFLSYAAACGFGKHPWLGTTRHFRASSVPEIVLLQCVAIDADRLQREVSLTRLLGTQV